jgi:acyl-CoA synthetase (AMP-forming)/AMP-acid ligase II
VSELVASFSRLVDAFPARRLIHVPTTGQSLTVQDVWHARGTHADMLRACGLGSGDLLLLAVGNTPACAALLLAARQLDIAVLAVDSGTPAPEILDLFARFGVAGCVVPVEHASPLGDLRAVLASGLVLVTPQPATHGGKRRYPGVALLKLTSGSTGLPKAACNTDAQLIVDSQQIAEAMRIGPDDTQIASIPLSHAYGVSVILIPALLQGTPIVLRESFVPHQLTADAAAYGARVFAGVPFMFDYFLAHPPPEGWPSSLGTLISAGARLMPETVRGFHDRFGIKIHSFYGTSESGGIAFDGSDDIAVLDTVGTPLPGVTITFRPDDDIRGNGGRVHIRTGGVASGYAVPTKVGTHEFGEPGGDFCEDGFLTGDIGHFDDGGRLHLTGRVSSFINVAGKKVQPAEVEKVLREMPGIRDVRVIAGADAQRGELVAACIVVDRAAAPITVLGVRRFCSSRLAPHKIPRVVVRLETLPLTVRGKVDRRALDEAVRASIAGFPEQLC